MAGSYNHCLGDDGKFTFDLIENMGDAEEACEDMFEMLALAVAWLEAYDGLVAANYDPKLIYAADRAEEKAREEFRAAMGGEK